MATPKGRSRRAKNGDSALYAQVGADVIKLLNAGAEALNITRGAYIERLVREMPVDGRGLPRWLAGITSDDREESAQAAA